MPSSRSFLVERVVNGQRDTRFSEQLPEGTTFVVLEEADHVHLVLGTDEELAGVGVSKPKAKPAAKKPAAKKPAAKKTAAKKVK